MAIKAVFSDKKLKVKVTKLTPNKNHRIIIDNLTTGATSAFSSKNKTGLITKTVSVDARGVVKTTINPAGEAAIVEYAVGTSEIDCCIAKLVNDAINCTCKCDKCKEDLKLAETIYLLLQAAVYDATLGLGGSAVDKYNKAKSMCVDNCACGC